MESTWPETLTRLTRSSSDISENLEAYRGFQLTQSFTDLVFIAEAGVQVHAHRAMMSSVSAMLRELWTNTGGGLDQNEVVILLPDMAGELVQRLVELVYTGDTSLSHDDVAAMKSLMSTLGITNLCLSMEPTVEGNMAEEEEANEEPSAPMESASESQPDENLVPWMCMIVPLELEGSVKEERQGEEGGGEVEAPLPAGQVQRRPINIEQLPSSPARKRQRPAAVEESLAEEPSTSRVRTSSTMQAAAAVATTTTAAAAMVEKKRDVGLESTSTDTTDDTLRQSLTTAGRSCHICKGQAKVGTSYSGSGIDFENRYLDSVFHYALCYYNEGSLYLNYLYNCPQDSSQDVETTYKCVFCPTSGMNFKKYFIHMAIIHNHLLELIKRDSRRGMMNLMRSYCLGRSKAVPEEAMCSFPNCTFAAMDRSGLKRHIAVTHLRTYYTQPDARGRVRIKVKYRMTKSGLECKICLRRYDKRIRIGGNEDDAIIHYAVHHDKMKKILSGCSENSDPVILKAVKSVYRGNDQK